MLVTLPKTNIAGWNIPMFNRKYIFNPAASSIDMLVYRNVFLILGKKCCLQIARKATNSAQSLWLQGDQMSKALYNVHVCLNTPPPLAKKLILNGVSPQKKQKKTTNQTILKQPQFLNPKDPSMS